MALLSEWGSDRSRGSAAGCGSGEGWGLLCSAPECGLQPPHRRPRPCRGFLPFQWMEGSGCPPGLPAELPSRGWRQEGQGLCPGPAPQGCLPLIPWVHKPRPRVPVPCLSTSALHKRQWGPRPWRHLSHTLPFAVGGDSSVLCPLLPGVQGDLRAWRPSGQEAAPHSSRCFWVAWPGLSLCICCDTRTHLLCAALVP